MTAPENLSTDESFDYETLEAVLAGFRRQDMDKAQAAREAQAFFDSRTGQYLKISGDAEQFVTPEGQLGQFDGVYKMPHRHVQISAIYEDGVAVRMHNDWIGMPNELPILLYATIDPHPPGSLDEVPPEEQLKA